MKYLLDTSVWLRGYLEPDTIPTSVRRILSNAQEIFGLNVISLWEVAKKQQRGKLRLSNNLNQWFTNALGSNVQVLPLTPEIILDATSLPDFPNQDPADELIVATARMHQLTLLTTDSKLKNYQHARIQYFTPSLA